MDSINFITVKLGTLYPSSYVNSMYEMVKQHCDIPFTFYCYTDNADGICDEVVVIEYVEHGLDIIPCNKLKLFDNNLKQLSGRNVYFDLDVIILRNITDIVSCPLDGKLKTITTWWRDEWPLDYDPTLPDYDHLFRYYMAKHHHRLNSSMMIWDSGTEIHDIWDHYMSNPEYYMIKFPWGMDAYLAYMHIEKIVTFDVGVIGSLTGGIDVDKEWEVYRFPDKQAKYHLLKYPPDTAKGWIEEGVYVLLFNGPEHEHLDKWYWKFKDELHHSDSIS